MPINYDRARSILGDDLITPEEIATARGITYSAAQLQQFADTLPAAEELQWLRQDDYILVPGPATPQGLLDIRAMHTAHFYTKEDGWYANADQTFSRNDKANVQWFKVPKAIYLTVSLNKSWDEQVAMIPEDCYILNATELAWVVTTYHAVRGIYLLPDHARTSSVSADGGHVGLGRFDSRGLIVGICFDHRVDGLGLAVARE